MDLLIWGYSKIFVRTTNGMQFLGHFYKSDSTTITVVDVRGNDIEEIIINKPDITFLNVTNEIQSCVPHIYQYWHFEMLNGLSFEFLNSVDNDFHKALEHIKSCHELAVYGFGCSAGRYHPLSYVAMRTYSQTFIFDVQGNGIIDELKQIFTSAVIRKICFNSKLLADCLFYKHNINLQTVFDVQVLDYMLRKMNGNMGSSWMRSMDELIAEYITVYITREEIAQQEEEYDEIIQRPLTIEKLYIAAYRVSYLYVIRDIMQTDILENFFIIGDIYMNVMRDINDENAIDVSSNYTPYMLNYVNNRPL